MRERIARPGSTVLELGAGRGELADGVRSLGAPNGTVVVATDMNARDDPPILPLIWGDTLPSSPSWVAVEAQAPYAVVLCADLVYFPGLSVLEEDTLEPLARTISAALAAGLLSDPSSASEAAV